MHRRWGIVRGIHRRVLLFLTSAVLLGSLVGWGVHVAATRGPTLALVGVVCTLLLLLWPLGWIATFRIARPMADLANVAGALREGELSRRAERGGGDEEVGEVADALNAMADRIRGQLDDQRALLAAVSHELRSPLGRIRVMVELSREGLAPDDLHDALQAEIDGMDALVGDLLAGSRIDFEAVQPAPLQAAEVARRALELAQVPESVLDVRGDGTVVADPTLLARALRGMLDNAVRHGGSIARFTVREDGPDVVFEVCDDGPGFRDGEETQVFEPFWRRPPEAGAAPSRGTGLGLALVDRIARAHEGSAGAANRPEGGACVWLRLPRLGAAEIE
ncbi:MAG: HAMP domain-containing sensor histidine kinase [Myxococcota bacterium]